MVSDGTEFAVGDIERLFDETRRNTKAKHEKWAKYYDRRRRDVQIKKEMQRREKSDAHSTSGYNFRPRRGAKVESRPTNEKRTQQGELVRAKGSRDHQYSPYIEEQARLAGRKTRSRSGQQQYCQERKGGANIRWSQSLEVLVGDVSYRK
ncbi:uncharacterized protein TNCV_1939571 [Trichonephila clavipes]|nr:uncharacterized protein TNCV_1939571 [Trichonephila clavipes]